MSKAHLASVAKEVGIAIHQRAHVVVVVTTSSFSGEALKYADEITRETHLQFALVPGKVVDAYLLRGGAPFLSYFIENAAQVMAMKRPQTTGAIRWGGGPASAGGAGPEPAPEEETATLAVPSGGVDATDQSPHAGGDDKPDSTRALADDDELDSTASLERFGPERA